MNSRVTIILIFGLVYLSGCDAFFKMFRSGQIISKCAKLSGTTISEMKQYKHGDKISRKMLCFMKCVGERTGFIEDSNIDATKLRQLPLLPKVPEDVYTRAEKCLEDLNMVVKNCKDMLPVTKCMKEFGKYMHHK